jgi:multidrug efflux pump subunit AcrA (membrane-fusion protein)
MYTSVWLEDLNVKGAIVIPSSLIQQDMNGEDFVFVAMGKGSERTVSKRILKTGLGSGDMMLIESGLRIGDEVISKGATRVIEGQEVSINAN